MPDTGAGAGGATVAGFGGSGCLPQLASKRAENIQEQFLHCGLLNDGCSVANLMGRVDQPLKYARIGERSP